MKKRLNSLCSYLLPTGILGVVGILLRLSMLKTGIDDKGLLIPFHIPSILLWGLSAGVCLWLLISLRNISDGSRYRDLFPKSLLSGTLSIAGGGLMILSFLIHRPEQVTGLILGLAAAGCMIFAGYCRIRGLHPNFLFHGLICLSFIHRLILNYQDWNANPQLHSYGIQMLACVMLMLGSFHRACCDANIFNRRKLGFSLLLAVYLCLTSVSDQEMGLYYLAAGLWAAGSLCRLDSLPVRAAPTAAEKDPVLEAEPMDPSNVETLVAPEPQPEEPTSGEAPAGDYDLLDDPFFASLLAEQSDEK
jgi:hypothetical protein